MQPLCEASTNGAFTTQKLFIINDQNYQKELLLVRNQTPTVFGAREGCIEYLGIDVNIK